MARLGANAIEAVNQHKYDVGSVAQLLCKWHQWVHRKSLRMDVLDIASGSTVDWAYDVLKIRFTYTIELPPSQGKSSRVFVSFLLFRHETRRFRSSINWLYSSARSSAWCLWWNIYWHESLSRRSEERSGNDIKWLIVLLIKPARRIFLFSFSLLVSRININKNRRKRWRRRRREQLTTLIVNLVKLVQVLLHLGHIQPIKLILRRSLYFASIIQFFFVVWFLFLMMNVISIWLSSRWMSRSFIANRSVQI